MRLKIIFYTALLGDQLLLMTCFAISEFRGTNVQSRINVGPTLLISDFFPGPTALVKALYLLKLDNFEENKSKNYSNAQIDVEMMP